jgi:hypothetical protein
MLHLSSECLNVIQVNTSALAHTVNRLILTGSIPVSMGFKVNKVALERVACVIWYCPACCQSTVTPPYCSSKYSTIDADVRKWGSVTLICWRGYAMVTHSCAVHLDTIESFIYQTDAQLDFSKMLKFTLKFTWEVLLHVSAFHNHYQGATVCALLKLQLLVIS